jgi:hypothetical protein
VRNTDPEDTACRHCGNGTVVCEQQGGCAEQYGPDAYCGDRGSLIAVCECWCCEFEREGK